MDNQVQLTLVESVFSYLSNNVLDSNIFKFSSYQRQEQQTLSNDQLYDIKKLEYSPEELSCTGNEGNSQEHKKSTHSYKVSNGYTILEKHSPTSKPSKFVYSNSVCPIDLPYSCKNSTFVEDSCCFEYPGGAILLTQFWDYNPATGPNDSFTLHGLWPDNCDGTYEQFCDYSLEIRNPAEIVEEFDSDLLIEMKRVWKDFRGNDEDLWYHEYNKHGTCYTTIKPSCYGKLYNSAKRQDVFDYYKRAISLNTELPTYDWLVAEGIVPSETETYTYEEVMGALKKNFGAEPYIKCDSKNALLEVWYFHNLKGSLVNGDFDRIDTLTRSKCPLKGIKFLPKIPRKSPIETNTRPHLPKPTDNSNRGFIKLTNQPGCLIKNGNWYTTGTCATYSLIPLSTGSYHLKSNAGYCTIEEGEFICSSNVGAPFEFNYDSDDKLLTANGEEFWSADFIPSGKKQISIKLGKEEGAINFKLKWDGR